MKTCNDATFCLNAVRMYLLLPPGKRKLVKQEWTVFCAMYSIKRCSLFHVVYVSRVRADQLVQLTLKQFFFYDRIKLLHINRN